MAAFVLPPARYNFSVPRKPHMAFLVELDVVGREQTRLAAEVAEPPVIVGKFLERRVSMEVKADINQAGAKLTIPVIFPPSGKLSSLSSAAW